MPITTRKRLVMTFKNANGSLVSLSLSDPKDTLTDAEVTSAMDIIIAKNIFATAGGDLSSKYRAAIIDTNTNELYTINP